MYLAHSPILWHIGYYQIIELFIIDLYGVSLHHWFEQCLFCHQYFLSPIFLVTFIFVTNIDAAD